MTVEQQQCLLKYLGYDPGTIDGIDGKRTQEAMTKFTLEYGAGEDGLVGAVVKTVEKLPQEDTKQETQKTGTFWDDIEFFTRKEFRCTCPRCGGFPVEPDEEMVRVVDEIRRRLGKPIAIVDAGGSGIRCKEHNAEVPGSSNNSWHLYGKAADMHAGVTPAQLKKVAEEVTADMIPGRGGIGIYNWGVHVDVGTYSRWDSRTA